MTNPGPSSQQTNNSYALTTGNFARTSSVQSHYAAHNNMGIVGAGRGSIISCFGDSIPYRCFYPDPIPAGTDYYSDAGYPRWGAALAGVKCSFLNHGIGGDTTAQILARIATPLQARPDICIVNGGTNDLVQGVATSVTIANLTSIYNQLMAAGIYVIALTQFPRNASLAMMQKAVAYINFQRSFFYGSKFGEVCDIYGALGDTTTVANNGGYITNATSDGTHPASYGGYLSGTKLSPILSRLCAKFPLTDSTTDTLATNTNSVQLLDNPLMLGSQVISTTGNSGTIALNWNNINTNTTTVWSTDVANGGIGNKIIGTITASSAGQTQTYPDSVSARAAISNTVIGSVRIKITSATALTGVAVQVGYSNGNYTWGYHGDGTTFPAGTSFELPAIYTPQGQLLTAVSSLYLNIFTYYSGAGGCTLEIEQAGLSKVVS